METITGTQSKAADRYAIDVMGIPSLTLMERASSSVAEFVAANYQGLKTVILAGTGNNGADGICVARMLMGSATPEAGSAGDADIAVGADGAAEVAIPPTVVIFGNLEKASWEFLYQLSQYKKTGGDVTYYHGGELPEGEVLVDAVFGIGLKSELRTEAAELLRKADAAKFNHVVAVDIPSGINADTGETEGAGIHAETTITFGKQKTGLVQNQGPEYAGKVIVKDIGIPEEAYEIACGT